MHLPRLLRPRDAVGRAIRSSVQVVVFDGPVCMEHEEKNGPLPFFEPYDPTRYPSAGLEVQFFCWLRGLDE